MSELVQLTPGMDRRPRTRAGLATLALGLAGTFNGAACLAADETPDARAAAAEDWVEEILLSAAKRSETVLDIPASITAISAATLEEAHVTQLDDLNALVTNL